MAWVQAGRAADEAVPRDKLTERELEELRQLLRAQERIKEQLLAVEQRIEVLVLSARDARGLSGRVRVNVASGELVSEEGNGEGDA